MACEWIDQNVNEIASASVRKAAWDDVLKASLTDLDRRFL